MPGGIEGEGRHVEPTSQQTKPERPQPQMVEPYRLEFLEEMRAISEKDPKLFATRVMAALDELVKESIPGAEQRRARGLEEVNSYRHAAGYTIEFLASHSQYVHRVGRKNEAEGHLSGLESVFGAMHRHITGAEPIQLKFMPMSDKEVKPEPKQ